jgi:hypothetical protein
MGFRSKDSIIVPADELQEPASGRAGERASGRAGERVQMQARRAGCSCMRDKLVAVACADTGAASWLQLHARRAGCSCMCRYRRDELVAVACEGGTMLFSYAIEGFLGWLSRFKLIRLRRISLETLRRDGRRGGCRQVVAFAPKVAKVIIIACLRQGFCIRKTR